VPSDRALARIWIKFADENLYALMHRLIFTREVDARQVLVEKLLASVRLLEDELFARRSGDYALDKRFTLADIALYPWFEQVGALEQLSEFKLPPGCAGLSEWRHAVSQRTAVRQCSRTADWYAERYRSYLPA